MRIFTYTGGDRQFDTVAKSQDIEEQLHQLGLGAHIQLARPITPADAAKYHTRAYVDALETGKPAYLASSSGLQWNVHYRNAIFGMAGAMMEAMQYALLSDDHAFALTAGAHHARPNKGAGFCALNSVAMAALYAARSTPRNVYILDVDAHAGGGTQQFITAEYNDHIHHLDVIVSGYDMYAPSRPQDAQITVDSYNFTPVDAYFRALTDVLNFTDEFNPPRQRDILIVNAGVDVHEDSAIGGWEGMDAAMITLRESLIREWAIERQMVVVGLLAGGYSDERFTPAMLADVHVRSIRALMGV